MTPIKSVTVKIPNHLLADAIRLAEEINSFINLSLCDTMDEDCCAPQIGFLDNRMVIPEECKDTLITGITEVLQVPQELQFLLTDFFRIPRKEPKPLRLWKTTIVIWSEADGPVVENMSLEDLAHNAIQGESYCSKQDGILVDDARKDPDWDGTEFFDRPEKAQEHDNCNRADH